MLRARERALDSLLDRIFCGKPGSTFPENALLTGPPRGAKGSTVFLAAEGLWTVAKPELGTKRQCGNCGAKFYDLQKDPIVCPKCATVLSPPTGARPRPEPVAARKPEPEEETLAPEV